MKGGSNDRFYIVRLTSSRGTDITKCLRLSADFKKSEIREIVEQYTDHLVDGTACREHKVTFRRVRMPNKAILKKRYIKACKAKEKAQKLWAETTAMMIPHHMH